MIGIGNMCRQLLWLAALAVGVSSTAHAELKIGVVSVPQLIEESPQAKSAMQALQDEFMPRRREIESQQKELKAREDVTPKGARRVEIRHGDVVGLLRLLQGSRGVHEATIFGENVHALVDEGVDLALPEGAEARTVTPSLEDVFVTLTRRASGV